MVTDPSTSSTVAFASTLDDVYKWNGTAWTSFGSAFPARPAGNRVLGLVGSSNTSYYVLYATVSTDSRARPRQKSNTQLETVMFLNPPLDSVPNLMRPVG